MVAWRFALAYPSMLHKLIIESAPHPMQVQFTASLKSRFTHIPELLFSFAAKKGAMDKIVLGDKSKFIWKAFRDDKFAPVSRTHLTDDDVRVFEASFLKPHAAECATSYYRHIGEVGKTKVGGYGDLGGVPVLCMTGALDANVKPASMAGLDEFVVDLRFEILPNCSHWVHEDALEEVNKLVRPFLLD